MPSADHEAESRAHRHAPAGSVGGSSAWLPDGIGACGRLTMWLGMVYAVLLSATICLFLFVPAISFPGAGAIASLPLTLGFIWFTTYAGRRTMRHAAQHDGAVCYECGYPGPKVVGDVCTECGRTRTANDASRLAKL